MTELNKIRELGWIENQRPDSDGGVGNTLEYLLGIEENNLPLPNAGEWEMKVQRKDTSSLITLFHMEPSPRAFKFVSKILLPKYGWTHEHAGERYPPSEMSFRQTLTSGKWTNRGFTISVNRNLQRVEVLFDRNRADDEMHRLWIANKVTGLEKLSPTPYWGFDDLYCKAGTKLVKTLYATAERKKEHGREYFRYTDFLMLEGFSKEKFLSAIESGLILVDFDARTGHNHGTKFRLKQSAYSDLYGSVKRI